MYVETEMYLEDCCKSIGVGGVWFCCGVGSMSVVCVCVPWWGVLCSWMRSKRMLIFCLFVEAFFASFYATRCSIKEAFVSVSLHV